MDAEAIEGGSDASDGVVELQNRVTAQSHRTFSAETVGRVARNVYIVGTQIHKEWTFFIFCHKFDGFYNHRIGQILVAPEGFSAAFHKTDAPDAVHNAHIVTVTRFQLRQQLRIVLTRRFAVEILVVRHINRCRRVVVLDFSLFDEHAGHAVGGRSHQIVVVEADVTRCPVQFGVPVLFSAFAAQSEMPFPDGSRAVASTLEHVGERVLLGLDNHSGVACGDVGACATEAIFARQH